jgi:hypothetical protein
LIFIAFDWRERVAAMKEAAELIEILKKLD